MTGPSKQNMAIKFLMRKAKESLKAGEAKSGEVIAILCMQKQGMESQIVAHPNWN